MVYQNVSKLAKEKGVKISKIEKDLGFPHEGERQWNQKSIGLLMRVANYLEVPVTSLILDN